MTADRVATDAQAIQWPLPNRPISATINRRWPSTAPAAPDDRRPTADVCGGLRLGDLEAAYGPSRIQRRDYWSGVSWLVTSFTSPRMVKRPEIMGFERWLETGSPKTGTFETRPARKYQTRVRPTPNRRASGDYGHGYANSR